MQDAQAEGPRRAGEGNAGDSVLAWLSPLRFRFCRNGWAASASAASRG